MKLKDFFQTVADQELQVERARQNLAALSIFEPFATFTRFDRNSNNKVTDLELYSFLRYTHSLFLMLSVIGTTTSTT